MSLKLWPDEILSLPCYEVKDFTYIPDLLDQMISVLEEHRALGLSAPQINQSLRVMIVRCKNDIIEIVNPEIISTEGEQYENEACLSFPGVTTKIKRPLNIHFTCQDRHGNMKEYLAYGIEAVCFQHEVDHLNGITILNKVNRAERKRILKDIK